MEPEVKNTREPSVSRGPFFGRPSLVTWTVAVIRGGGSGRVSQYNAAPATTEPASVAHFNQARRFGAAALGKDGDDGRRANARSAADWNRRSGSFSRHRRTIPPSSGGTEAGNSAGSSFNIACIPSTEEEPEKARLPESISCSTTPKLNRSERWSAASPRTRSEERRVGKECRS